MARRMACKQWHDPHNKSTDEGSHQQHNADMPFTEAAVVESHN
jgi:hypothetical protein